MAGPMRVEVEVRATRDPRGRPAVLLQLPDGYVVMKAADARIVSELLNDAAAEVEEMAR